MKLGIAFFAIFFIGILFIGTTQVYNSSLSSDKVFDKQVKNHLISTVDMKGERINDYLLEKIHDVRALALANEIKEILVQETSSGGDIVVGNIENELDILSKQIKIYVEKYPTKTFSDWQNDEDFQKIASKKIGKTDKIVIVDFDTFDKNEFDFYRDTKAVTSEGITIGIAAKINFDDFKELKNKTSKLTETVDRFSSISNYTNLILIDDGGYVIYEVNKDKNFGVNLNFGAYNSTLLAKGYSKTREKNSTMVYGPYQEIGKEGLSLFFISNIYQDNESLGTIILQDSMSEINEISNESVGLGDTGISYLIDKNNYLITPIKNIDINPLVQKITTINSQNCFNYSDERVSYFEDFKGDLVIGSYYNIEKTSWCLLAEITSEEVFKFPKQKGLKKDLMFIATINVILSLIIILISTRLGEKYTIKKRTKRK